MDVETKGWGWNLEATVKEPLLLPTLYTIDGLIRVDRRFGTQRGEIQTAILFCLTEAERATPPVDAEDNQVYSWKTSLYKLCEVISQSGINLSAEQKSRLEFLLQNDRRLSLSLKEFKRFEYRLQHNTNEEHAFCVLPTGLMQYRAELWLNRAG